TTDAYVVGEASDADIAEMQSQGVLVELLPSVDEFIQETAGAELFSVGPAEDEPGHHLITFLMPLNEQMRKELEAAGVNLLTHVPPSSYVAYLTPDQVGT